MASRCRRGAPKVPGGGGEQWEGRFWSRLLSFEFAFDLFNIPKVRKSSRIAVKLVRRHVGGARGMAGRLLDRQQQFGPSCSEQPPSQAATVSRCSSRRHSCRRPSCTARHGYQGACGQLTLSGSICRACCCHANGSRLSDQTRGFRSTLSSFNVYRTRRCHGNRTLALSSGPTPAVAGR